MEPLIEEIAGVPPMDEVADAYNLLPGFAYLRTGTTETPGAVYSIIAAEPFLVFRSFGSTCQVYSQGKQTQEEGNPWRLLDHLLGSCESSANVDLPFPVGAGLGFWGYGLRSFTEPKLRSNEPMNPFLPDCHVGFHGTLVIHDHRTRRTFLVATGLQPGGERSLARARAELDAWRARLGQLSPRGSRIASRTPAGEVPLSCMSREHFIENVVRAQRYIQAGDIYQVNLSRAWVGPCHSPWAFFQRLCSCSPAPFSAFMRCADADIVSSSPEQFLRFDGLNAQARPIKGTRPRGGDLVRDARFARELRASPKENAELLMITDLLRNDLGKVSEFGSVRVPELAGLERYSHVQHLVATVESQLRPGLSHLSAMQACFPGGSITGAPKFRAMEIIDELEPLPRGPYTGALGYIGFNRKSLLSILIRTAVCSKGRVSFHAGAGIVADSDPAAEYEETRIKAQAIVEALTGQTLRISDSHDSLSQR